MSSGNARQRRKTTESNSQDFVSSDVNRALQEARHVVNRKKQNSNENLIEESTTVQVRNSGKKTDPFEVFISRSTITHHDNSSEDELMGGSLSDSDIARPQRTRSSSSHHKCLRKTAAGSDTNVYNTAKDATDKSLKHTNVRYRRKQGKFWTRDDDEREVLTDETQSDEEDAAQLEIDVKEECCEVVDGNHVVKKTWEARWTVCNFEALPEWLQDNEYLLTGHRPPLPSFAECFKSIWALHTETGNIWTHLIGAIAFFCLACYYLTHSEINLQEKVVFSFFFFGAILCLGLSFTFHTMSCHSITVIRIFSKLDYMGISLLIIGSFIPWLYYGFYCRRSAKITYISMVVILGIAAVIVSLWDKFSESRYRPLRAGVFVSMSLSGIIPAIHFIYTDGMRTLIDENAFYWLLAMAGLYLTGAFLYATRTPERFFPGKFDIWFQSHQLFHVFVVTAAFVHYFGISQMAMNKLARSCDVNEISNTPTSQSSLHSEL
ncbi:hypothetical protein M3Y94_00972000 [Aphelenchoides besseyi]|nr:hypothetical protein M3Y94_00972000 [Aphelenchoides besseyi]KAI6224607.1 hypothetical protein M3Y95_00770700 [Aphelenchoides besseyi]